MQIAVGKKVFAAKGIRHELNEHYPELERKVLPEEADMGGGRKRTKLRENEKRSVKINNRHLLPYDKLPPGILVNYRKSKQSYIYVDGQQQDLC